MGRGGRSSGRSSGGSPFGKPATAPPRSAPAPVAQKPAPKPAAAPAPAAAPPTPAPAASAGSGLLGTMAASAAGSVAGHYLANSLFGGNSEAAPAHVPPQTQQAIDSEYGACAPSFKTFLACAEANENDISNCQWAYGAFAQCTKSTKGAQPALQSS